MIHMFMGNKDINRAERLQIARKKLETIVQLLLFPAPVIEYKKNVLRLDGKTAVIEMCNPDLLIHRRIAPPSEGTPGRGGIHDKPRKLPNRKPAEIYSKATRSEGGEPSPWEIL